MGNGASTAAAKGKGPARKGKPIAKLTRKKSSAPDAPSSPKPLGEPELPKGIGCLAPNRGFFSPGECLALSRAVHRYLHTSVGVDDDG
jgi:hypothetical protein